MARRIHIPENLPIIPRHEAMAQGRQFYRTGIPCKYGHDAPRFTGNGSCVDCQRRVVRLILDPIKQTDLDCSVDGCTEKVHGKNLCQKHYYMWKRYGDPLAPLKQVRGALERWIDDHKNYTGTDCLIWPFGSQGKTKHGKKVKGYGRSHFNGKGIGAHVHMAIVVYGDLRGSGMLVRHLCGNGYSGCCHPGHLSWGTHKDNMADMRQHKAQASGERCARAKWTDADILRMLRMKDEVSRKELAKMFGMSLCNVQKIIARTAWKHLG